LERDVVDGQRIRGRTQRVGEVHASQRLSETDRHLGPPRRRRRRQREAEVVASGEIDLSHSGGREVVGDGDRPVAAELADRQDDAVLACAHLNERGELAETRPRAGSRRPPEEVVAVPGEPELALERPAEVDSVAESRLEVVHRSVVEHAERRHPEVPRLERHRPPPQSPVRDVPRFRLSRRQRCRLT
jgi:hypothetical protein